ncbi:N-acetylmannosamine-6-phosphate 2-epimerase [Culicoidibacter larvae]|uniref:Putative N-acetylmannosamine-6-phosphate 2-epimerase n=1 Tax=Culicoidibacter larvae TaxID=2579976 RepID=A0A5R8QJP6_9FIRM|nr:N-acetylmannosamine-6-phosphate 2-epimerase [Culicoidibacter larvae]TLG77487.1 N-acetylmannosamine-6-phosphate 2-epimerase [Culicoidibacter larvae]
MLEQIKNKLVVSCQALPEEPLHSSLIMGRMALAAELGGAAGIRAQSKADILEIERICSLPVIGIVKRKYEDSEVFITATEFEVNELLETNCAIIAMDATKRPRPNGTQLADLLALVHAGGRLAMADCSTFEECLAAQALGFDVVSTTLCGYTSYSEQLDGPNFALLKRCVTELQVPIIAEGKINTPEDLRRVYDECGVYSAVVGGAITRPQQITARFVKVLEGSED